MVAATPYEFLKTLEPLEKTGVGGPSRPLSGRGSEGP